MALRNRELHARNDNDTTLPVMELNDHICADLLLSSNLKLCHNCPPRRGTVTPVLKPKIHISNYNRWHYRI